MHHTHAHTHARTHTHPHTHTVLPLTLLCEVPTAVEVPSVDANGKSVAPGNQLDLIVSTECVLCRVALEHDTNRFTNEHSNVHPSFLHIALLVHKYATQS